MEPPEYIPAGERDLPARREQLARLAWLLDSAFQIPGTRFSIGLEALLGLIPFLGDVLGVLLSSFILLEAARMGVPRAVLYRMAANIALEGVVGIVPVAGDLFDAAWKANQKNVRLLEAHFREPERTRATSRRWAILAVVVLCVLLLGACWLAFVLLRWLWSLITSGATV